ncbi:hypothetical protein [Actinomadura sp. 7K507]|uniref:hypothetical protein n=1 Tax=Actinomadura sp. 7K507 TaxID=2530365 RepID=UPI001052D9C7|nr:hypothetical protein [Actinomadura sp. 7K507]TDC91962.1 hypothetical protein E1285_12335 [Actinomadura sp. 7K507]
MSDSSREPHPIQCALDLRARVLAERGQEEVDPHGLADQIRQHCHHTRFKSMRLAHGWRRVDDAVDAIRRWQIEQGHSATGLDIRSWQNWEAGSRPGPHNLDLLSRFFASDAVCLGFAPSYRQVEAQSVRQEHARPLMPEQAVAVCAEESQRYGARMDTPIGSYTIDELEAALHAVAGAYPYTPVLPTLMRAKELRLRAWTLREQCHRPMQIHDLHRIAGWLSVVMANASFDLGGMAAAQTHLRVSDLHAELVGDATLRAWSRSLHALIAYWDGRPHDAAEHAAYACSFTGAQGTTLLRAYGIRARALAQLGEISKADASLRKVEELRQDDQRDEFPGILTFPQAKSWFWTASAHIGLGMRERAAQAEDAALSALELYGVEADERRRSGEMSLTLLDLATARLLRGEHDGIEANLRPVFSAMQRRRIEIIVRRMLQLTAILEQPACRAIQPLREVREELHDYIHYSRQSLSLPQAEVNA